MYDVSPIRYFHKTKTPALICLGTQDKRVPVSQGIDYYKLLQSNGVKSRLLLFPEDCHALDKVSTEAEHVIAMANWFSTHLLC
jgi:acylaminoacyl-peptidase